MLVMTLALVMMGHGAIAKAADLRAAPSDTSELARPQRETDLIKIYDDARTQLGQADTMAARTGVRLDMQIRVAQLLQPDTNMIDWTGVLKGIGKTREGDVWVKIEIARNVLITTLTNPTDDPARLTLLAAGSPLAKAASQLKVDDPVVFRGQIRRILISGDDDMIQHPTMSAHFDSLKPLAEEDNSGVPTK